MLHWRTGHLSLPLFQFTKAWSASAQNPSRFLRSDSCFLSFLFTQMCTVCNNLKALFGVELFPYCSNKVNFSIFLQDTSSSSSESSQVRTGKWKVPASHDYLPLYKNLLDCDRLKVHLCSYLPVKMHITHYMLLSCVILKQHLYIYRKVYVLLLNCKESLKSVVKIMQTSFEGLMCSLFLMLRYSWSWRVFSVLLMVKKGFVAGKCHKWKAIWKTAHFIHFLTCAVLCRIQAFWMERLKVRMQLSGLWAVSCMTSWWSRFCVSWKNWTCQCKK